MVRTTYRATGPDGAQTLIPSAGSGTFYFSDVTSGYDWTAPQNDALWQDMQKTLFDPCPAGWQVPRGGTGDSSVWRTFTKDNGTWSETELAETPGRGYHWSSPQTFGGTAWYGTHPHRPVSSLMMGAGSSALDWTTTTVETSAYRCSLGIAIAVAQQAGRTNGLPVRCIRE